MITENLSTLKIHKLTQAQYDRELAAGNIDESALYLTPEASPDWNASEGEDGYIKNRTHWVDYVDFEWSGTPSFSNTESLPAGTLYPYKIATIDKNFNYCTLSCGSKSWNVKVNPTKWTTFPESSRVSFGAGTVYLAIYNGELYMYATSVAMGYVGVYTINNCGNINYLPSVYIDEDIARRSQLYEVSSSVGKLNNLVGETAVSAQIDTAIKNATPNWNAAEGENGHILNRTHYKIDIDFDCSSYIWNTAETAPDSSLAYVANIGSFKIDKDAYDMVNGNFGNLYYDLLNLFGANYKKVKFGEIYKSISGPSVTFCLNETAIYNADDNTYTLDLNMYSSSSSGFYSESPTITNVVAVVILEDVYIPDTIARIDAVPTRISELTNDSGFVTNNDLNAVINTKAPIASPEFTGSISLGRKSDTLVGNHSFAVGMDVEASGINSHAEGRYTKALAIASHAEGHKTEASGYYSHAEGSNTIASGTYSHAEGMYTTASGQSNHAEGAHTTASGDCSHVEGFNTIASGELQHVQGKFNIEDTANTYAHIVGNGTSDARSNAHTLDWEGNAWYAGSMEGTALILKSPSGARFKITVDNNGNLTTTAL